ncbi:MAG TPA: zinc ABC transporter substrate-binding protein [Acidimicrobiales bacterium]|jgi:zinc/manganese transport system substrate-binding protein
MERSPLVVGGIVLALLLASACSTASSTPAAHGPIAVVAAENFWGSIAAQLGGDRVDVTNLIDNPATDPHDYEPTAADARGVATAGYVIGNGLGYDPWIDDLVHANPAPARRQLRVGDLVGLKDGDNPHRWYSPADVHAVIDRITADYKALRPTDAAYFDQLHQHFVDSALQPYDAVIAEIRARDAGRPIGASESIMAPMAQALGLDLVTPSTFLDAISEGNDPTAADKATVDHQITTGAVEVFVFNRQNATPDVQRLVDAARRARIPVVAVTETLTPAGATFQDWQTAQLHALDAALGQVAAG